MTPQNLITHLMALGKPDIAAHSQRFFKTGAGEYGEGDVFLGVRVPVIRKAVQQFKTLSIDDAEHLLNSEFHEVRLFAVLLLVAHFQKGSADEQKSIYELYLRNTQRINSWDIVDSSAWQIVGGYLFDKDKAMLSTLAQSESLWERRISIIATYYFIKQAQYDETLRLADLLLGDDEDLIHKAVGWMLREVGKRDQAQEIEFLNGVYCAMPRTMLRYAIEKLEPGLRKQYLLGQI